MPRTTFVLLSAWVIAGCTSSHGEAGDPCTRASDCAVAELACVYDTTLGCAATGGTCRNIARDSYSAFCQSGYVGCGCDGTPVTVPVCWGTGASPAPLRSTSPCDAGDAGDDDGGPTFRDAGAGSDAAATDGGSAD